MIFTLLPLWSYCGMQFVNIYAWSYPIKNWFLGQSTIAAGAAVKQGAVLAGKQGVSATSRTVGWWMAGCAGKQI